MTWLDWILVFIPLAAGRVAGRYVLCVATFPCLILLCLAVAVWIVTMGGQVTIMVTDCVQGLVSYPMYAAIVIYLACRLSWDTEDRPSARRRFGGVASC